MTVLREHLKILTPKQNLIILLLLMNRKNFLELKTVILKKTASLRSLRRMCLPPVQFRLCLMYWGMLMSPVTLIRAAVCRMTLIYLQNRLKMPNCWKRLTMNRKNLGRVKMLRREQVSLRKILRNFPRILRLPQTPMQNLLLISKLFWRNTKSPT